ncbi:protoglobin domain-containing protein [Phenylobacterium sp. LH3H17]|uniref:protoglobin domain-containing protein n=1 Tax=Phenylobacterium sp. LH3H17 TaxID=2903901 RepID=UPI0020C9FCE0|nr:protoglobin domain-containing protein [Phenylobacterium sp. LH3H17]UTP38317.1 protoglobin domain-containing protein [Phenylobacterium sp. LH3H17]
MAQSNPLHDRLSFMKVDAAAQADLQRAEGVIMGELPAAPDAFYAHLQACPETRKVFASQAHIVSPQSRQLAHWSVTSTGRFDEEYVRAVTKVGEIHARIGLKPRWEIGGYPLVLEALLGAVQAGPGPRQGLGA